MVKQMAGITCAGRNWLPCLFLIRRLMKEIENVQRKVFEGTEIGGSEEQKI